MFNIILSGPIEDGVRLAQQCQKFCDVILCKGRIKRGHLPYAIVARLEQVVRN